MAAVGKRLRATLEPDWLVIAGRAERRDDTNTAQSFLDRAEAVAAGEGDHRRVGADGAVKLQAEPNDAVGIRLDVREQVVGRPGGRDDVHPKAETPTDLLQRPED